MPSVIKGVGKALGGVVGVAFGVVFDLVGELFSGLLPKVPEIGADTSNQELRTAAASKRTRIYGETIVSGPIVKYEKVANGEKEYHHFFTPLANHVCESVNLYQLDGKSKTSMTGTGYILVARLGDQTTAPTIAVSEMSSVDDTFVGFGVTDVYHRYEINTDLFPNGVHDVKFIVKGAALYDPRKDSNQGGTGTHRHNDSSTWEWSDNNALVNFDWKRFYGDIELDIELFDLNNIAAEANLCDELVDITDKDGIPQQEKRYTCNGVVNLSVKPKTVQSSLLVSCAGQWIFSGGKYYLAVAAYRGPATKTITESDLKGDVKRDPSTALEDRCNAVTSTFISKALYYQKTDSTPVISLFYKNGRDKGRYLETDRSFNFVQTDTHCQRLNRLYMEYVAAGDTLELSVGVIGLKCAKGTTVNVHLPDSFIINKEYEVIENNYDIERQGWLLVLKETAPEIYDDSITPAETDLTPNTEIDNTYVAQPTSLSFTATLNDSYRQGQLTWAHPAPDSVKRYIVLITENPASTWYQSYYTSNLDLDITHLPVGDYIAAICAENIFARKSVASVKTFNVGLPSTPITAMRVDVLPGRVVIVGPELPNSAATYQWRYLFADDFENAIHGQDGNGITVVGTQQDDTLYLWYRIVENDLVDANFVPVIIEDLIGIDLSAAVTPEIIASLTLPGLPSTLLETISGFTETDAGLLANIVANTANTALVDVKTNTVSVQVGNADAKAVTAIAAIATETDSRGLLEQQVQANFENMQTNYLTQVDLYAADSIIRATVIELIEAEVDGTNVSAQITAFKNAQIGYEDESGDWIEGAAFAQAFDEVTITNLANETLSVYQYFQALETATGELKGRIEFVIDNDGRLTGVYVEGTPTLSVITLAAENFRVVAPNGDVLQEWDTVNQTTKNYGTFYAENMVGDTAAGRTAYVESNIFDSGTENGEYQIMEVEISPQNYTRTVFIPCPWFLSSTPGQYGKVTLRWYKKPIGGNYGSASYTNGLIQGTYNYSSYPFSFFLAANEGAQFKLTGQHQAGGQVNIFQQIYKVEVYRQSSQIEFTHGQPV
jgi:hypothetical protein